MKYNVNIVEYLESEGVVLKWNGKRYFGCCPIHQEKVPSMLVDTESNKFHCFGCGEHGDAIDLCQKIHHVDFKKALKILGLSSGLVTKAEMEKIAEQTALARKRREKEARFQTWCSQYFDNVLDKIEVIKQASKALTIGNFSRYCGVLGSLSYLEYHADILQFGSRKEKIELYVLTGGRSEKPEQVGYGHPEAE